MSTIATTASSTPANCGVNELNVWPWHDCAIGPVCRFCGINAVVRDSGRDDAFHARTMGRQVPTGFGGWLGDLRAAVELAVADPMYDAAIHPMIISVATLLAGCRRMMADGVVAGASVLHLDEGAPLRDVAPPPYEDTLWFYRELAALYREFGMRPYFDSLALRSSLANEAFDGQL